ncbi:hypothetical protein B0T25DRAFT_450902, partial [Lasiosphaeria hispida]
QCWVCDDQLDDRTHNPKLRVLCWEDIDLWIMQDPMGDGSRDYLMMQILLRFHKDADNEMVPTWFPFVKKKLPILCLISQLLAKALVEGVIDSKGYDQAKPFFNTKISMPTIHIPWKKEFWHKPMFWQTVKSVEGPVKSDELLIVKMFDNNLRRIGQAVGLFFNFLSYPFFHGNPTLANMREENYCLAVWDQGAWHKSNSTMFQRFYNNAKRDALAQNAGLGHSIYSLYLDILSHISIQFNKNAPMGVSDEMIHAIGLSNTVCQLERKWLDLEAKLQAI